MASVVRAFLILLVHHAQLSLELESKLTKEPETKFFLAEQGGEIWFKFMSLARQQSNFAAALYRSTTDGYLFLKNTSNPSQFSELEQAERVDTQWLAFTLKNLSISDTGDYMTKRWNKDLLKEERKYSLIVCNDQCAIKIKNIGSYFELVVNNTKEIWDRLQVYGGSFEEKECPGMLSPTPIMDTKLPPERSDQRVVVEVSDNSTTVRIFTYGKHFLIWSGNQCCFSTYMITNVPKVCLGPALLQVPKSNILCKQGERLTLPCQKLTVHAEEIVWMTPVKKLSVDVAVSHNMSRQEQEDMYIDTKSYSLVIPSLEANHAGKYECRPDFQESHVIHEGQYVFVCSDLEATHVLFSVGEAADLVCGADLNVSVAKVIFYGHLDQEQEQLSLSPEHMKVINEKRINKGTMFHDQFYLTMPDLTLNDSGLYLCRIWGYAEEWKPFCYDRKIYLLYKHPFGIDSTFSRVYSSLMACGLLGMICAVIFVHLRVRGRDRTSQSRLRRTAEPSGCPTREGEQTGGEPDHDDVITAEDV